MYDVWNRNYIIAIFKGLFVSLFIGILLAMVLSYATYVKSGGVSINLAFVSHPIFYMNFVVFTLFVVAYFIYEAREEF